MVSRTEEALLALFAKIGEIAAANASTLPAPFRNETIPERLLTVGETTTAFLNLLDGEGGPEGADGGEGETLGADVSENGYEIIQRAELEWIVSSSVSADRDALFDAGMVTVYDALKLDRQLGGVVSWVTVDGVARTNLVTEGLPHLKAASLTVSLTFLSSRPF